MSVLQKTHRTTYNYYNRICRKIKEFLSDTDTKHFLKKGHMNSKINNLNFVFLVII